MKKYFEADKPSAMHAEYMQDFIAGYEACLKRLDLHNWRALLDEFSARHPIGDTPGSMKAYFYAKGEFAALGDNM